MSFSKRSEPENLHAMRNKVPFFADSSLQASQQGTKTQGATKKEEKRRIGCF